MEPDDVSDAPFYGRVAHYRRQLHGKEATMTERIRVQPVAIEQATAEMLDEIHTMLRSLLARGGDNG